MGSVKALRLVLAVRLFISIIEQVCIAPILRIQQSRLWLKNKLDVFLNASEKCLCPELRDGFVVSPENLIRTGPMLSYKDKYFWNRDMLITLLSIWSVLAQSVINHSTVCCTLQNFLLFLQSKFPNLQYFRDREG